MKNYSSPALERFGTVSSLTAAIGPDSRPDQSDFSQIPADTGSVDALRCNNDNPDVTC